MGLPAVVEQLLIDVVADGFMLYCCGPKAARNALVASYEWDHHIDLLTIRNFDRVSAARVPKRATVDIVTPEVVVWSYQGPPQPALRVCWNWYTQRIPTPPPPTIRRQQACAFPAPSNAR